MEILVTLLMLKWFSNRFQPWNSFLIWNCNLRVCYESPLIPHSFLRPCFHHKLRRPSSHWIMTQALILPPWIPTTGCLKIVANNPTKPLPPFVCNHKLWFYYHCYFLNYVYLLFTRHPYNLCYNTQFVLLSNGARHIEFSSLLTVDSLTSAQLHPPFYQVNQ